MKSDLGKYFCKIVKCFSPLQVGLFSGAFLVLLISVVLSAIFHDYSTSTARDDWRIVFRLYRGPFLVILFLFLLGINVYGWRYRTILLVLFSSRITAS